MNSNNAWISSFSTKEKGRPFEIHILTINVSNKGVSLCDIGFLYQLVKVDCEVTLDTVEVEHLRYLEGGVLSLLVSLYYKKINIIEEND